MTKVDPPNPMKKRRMESDVASFTSPVRAHGIEAAKRTTPIRIRAPYLSQRGPLMKRMTMVPATEQMFEVQICCLESPRVNCTSDMSGAMANQIKKAVKKHIHEQWNARM